MGATTALPWAAALSLLAEGLLLTLHMAQSSAKLLMSSADASGKADCRFLSVALQRRKERARFTSLPIRL